MKSSKIYVVGDITPELYEAFARELDAKEHNKAEGSIVEVELSSEGGDAYVSLAFADRIRRSPCEVRITGTGFVASAAVLILASGDFRRMTKESWLMVHEESDELSGEVHEIERAAKHYRSMEDQADRLLAENSRLTKEEWKQYHKDTTYLTADECLRIGLIEEIV